MTATATKKPPVSRPVAPAAKAPDVYSILESRTMMREMTSFARDLSGNYKVNCIIARTGDSYTSKNNIIVLDSSSGDIGGFGLEDRIRLLRSLNIHESYHHIETLFEEWEEWTRAPRRKNPSIEQPFLNIVEDAWIEWSCSQKTPIFYRDIVWLNECLVRAGFDSVGEGTQLARFQKLLLFFLVGKEDLAHKETDMDVVKRFREAQEISGGIFKWAPFSHRTQITEDILRLVSDWYDASPSSGQQAGQFLQFHGAPPQPGRGQQSAPQQVKPKNGPQGAKGPTPSGSSSSPPSGQPQPQQASQSAQGGAQTAPSPAGCPEDGASDASGNTQDATGESTDSNQDPSAENPQDAAASGVGEASTDPSIGQENASEGQENAGEASGHVPGDAAGEDEGAPSGPSEEELQQAEEELQRRIQELIDAAELENQQKAERLQVASARAAEAAKAPEMGRTTIVQTSVNLADADSAAVAEMVGEGLAYYQESLASTRVGVVNMRRELSILRSENPDYVTGQMTGSRVDFRRKLRGEDQYLMRRQIRENDFDPAICVMLDFSGSTQDETIQVAYRDTVLMLREFCRSADIPFSVFGHNIGSKRVFHVYPIQFFEQEEWDPVKWVRYNPDDNARDDLAIRYGASYLAKQQKPDKLLFVLADGEPYHPAGGYDESTALEFNNRAVQDAKKLGVEAISIGVGVDLSKFFPKSIHVEHPNEMGKHLAGMLRSKFRGY